MKIYDYSTAYGVVLGGEARKLRQCFRKYVQSHKEKIFQTIQENVEFVEVRTENIIKIVIVFIEACSMFVEITQK